MKHLSGKHPRIGAFFAKLFKYDFIYACSSSSRISWEWSKHRESEMFVHGKPKRRKQLKEEEDKQQKPEKERSGSPSP